MILTQISTTPPPFTAFANALGVSLPSAGDEIGAAPGADDLGALINDQARFRIEGTGPLSQRRVVAITAGARELVATQPATTDAVRSLLALVEHAAGGPAASRNVEMHGIALATEDDGHGANVYAAHADNDAIFAASMGRAKPSERAQIASQVARSSFEYAPTTKAMVTSGWLNLNLDMTRALLAAKGAPVPDSTPEDAALAVRILRHEAQHLADQSRPGLTDDATDAFHEALAEAHSTHLPQLQVARSVLGLDRVVSDEDLSATLATRPYPQYESVLAQAVRYIGIDPTGPQAARLLASPASAIGSTLIRGIAKADGTSIAQAQTALSNAFAPTADAR